MLASGPVVVVEGLCKDYGGTRAVDDLSFTIEAGEVFALLGPNGAGKTTTVEILEGHRNRTAGNGERPGLRPGHRGAGVPRPDRDRAAGGGVRRGVHGPRARDASTRGCTRGAGTSTRSSTAWASRTRRRRAPRRCPAASAGASTWPSGWSAHPSCCSSTSPRPGFDPSARRRAWDLVASLRELGTTIVLTTHYMEEAERLADRVAVIQSGRLVALDTPTNLVRTEGAEAIITFVLPDGVGPEGPPPIGVGPARTNGQQVDIGSADPDAGPQCADRVGSRPGDRAGGADDGPAHPRGRLPGPHPGAVRWLSAAPTLGADAVRPGPLRQPRVLAHADRGVLHDRVPAELPGHPVHALRQRGDRRGHRPAAGAVHHAGVRGVRRLHGLLRLAGPRAVVRARVGVLKRLRGTPAAPGGCTSPAGSGRRCGSRRSPPS